MRKKIMIKKITKKRKLELKAERDLTRILYDARDNIQIDEEIRPPLTKEEIQNVIDHYLY